VRMNLSALTRKDIMQLADSSAVFNAIRFESDTSSLYRSSRSTLFISG